MFSVISVDQPFESWNVMKRAASSGYFECRPVASTQHTSTINLDRMEKSNHPHPVTGWKPVTHFKATGRLCQASLVGTPIDPTSSDQGLYTKHLYMGMDNSQCAFIDDVAVWVHHRSDVTDIYVIKFYEFNHDIYWALMSCILGGTRRTGYHISRGGFEGAVSPTTKVTDFYDRVGDEFEHRLLAALDIVRSCEEWLTDPSHLKPSGIYLCRGKKSNFFLRPAEEQLPTWAIRSTINHEFATLQKSADELLHKSRPQLHAKSFDTLEKFDGNLLLLLSKLQGIGTTSLVSLVEFARSGQNLKDIASLWLASRYGDRLSISGFADLVRSVDKAFWNVSPQTVKYLSGKARLGATLPIPFVGDVLLNSQIAVEPVDYNGLMKSVRTLMEWDLWPSLSNVWDALPLSFVIDWFVNVGDIYASIDRLVQSRYYSVIATLDTVKAETYSVQFPSLSLSYYSRKIGTELSLGVSSVELGLPSLINCISGGALITGFL